MMRRRIRERHLFAFLDDEPTRQGPIPATNNLIESWSARLRDMMRRHRGLRLIRRIKAICRWCHQHSQHPQTPQWPAANAFSDQRIEDLCKKAWESGPQGAHETYGIPNRYGTGINWNEFHTTTRYPNETN
jgi:putative transposase